MVFEMQQTGEIMKQSSNPHLGTRKQLHYTSNRILAPTKHQGANHHSQQGTTRMNKDKVKARHNNFNFAQQEAHAEKAQL